jgi:hypothetical protein
MNCFLLNLSHPDRNPDCKDCEAKFATIADAYAHLTQQEETVVQIAPGRWDDIRKGKNRGED